MATPANQTGRITQVIGSTFDAEFEGQLPSISERDRRPTTAAMA